MLRICLFGHVALAADDTPLPPSGRREVDRLLAYLLLHIGEPRLRDQVARELWPNASREAALDKLRPTLSHLQSYLRTFAPGLPEGDTWLLSDRRQLAWNSAAPYQLDVEVFEAGAAALADAGSIPVEAEIHAIEAALAVYIGPLLREFGDHWAVAASERCEIMATQLQTELAGLYEQSGRHQAALEVARQLVARDPLCEDSHALLIRLLVHAGDRSAALTQLDACRASLDQAFGVSPRAATLALVTGDGSAPSLSPDGLEGEDSGAGRRSTGQAIARLPERVAAAPIHATRLVDSRRVERIHQLLATARLVTLTGPPGCGKSRLAAAVAERAATTAGGLWYVDVATPSGDAAIRAIMARRTAASRAPDDAVAPQDAVPLELPTLIVLDNTDAAACTDIAAALLSEYPSTRILVTGREPLFLDGEVVWTVPLLDTAADVDGLARARPSEAATLFLDRAARWGGVGRPAPADLAEIEAICRSLDGLPMAIEVAAAWTAERTPSAIRQGVDDRAQGVDDCAWLARPCPDAASRFATLAEALEASAIRLEDSAAALFRRLSVLESPFSLDQAEAVAAGDLGGGDVPLDRVMDLLAHLVDASLVVADVNGVGARRHRLLRVVRQFAWIKLAEAGELAAAERRLARQILGASPEPRHMGT